MRIVASEGHRQHHPSGEIYGGQLVEPFESPRRWDTIMAALADAGFSAPTTPDPLDQSPLHRIHRADFLEFLATAWDRWHATGYGGDAIPTVFPVQALAHGATRPPPEHIDGLLGYYSLATETAITQGTWAAALDSAAVAQSAQRLVTQGEGAAFAVCRPPGHHATSGLYGGYCFINNAALAAQGLLDDGADRVAILDVDFHHGNGTQDIAWDRPDLLFASIHGEPAHAFPHFTGYADETGGARAPGGVFNAPLPPETAYDRWNEAFDAATGHLLDGRPDALVVSLGVDTFERDPISFFRLRTDDFADYGRRIGRLGLPTVFVMEGGYAVDEIGLNVTAVLTGFLDTHRPQS